MQPRPENHVTRALEARMQPSPAESMGFKTERPLPPLPSLSEPALLALEALFPPRCYDGRESIEQHLLYAGKVELVGDLRAQHQRELARMTGIAVDTVLGDLSDEGWSAEDFDISQPTPSE